MKKIKDLFNKLKEVRKWKLCILYNGIKIKTIKVKKEKLMDLKNEKYVITVINKRQLFKAFIVNIVVRPVVLLHTDEKHYKVYIGVVMEEGQKL